jgi:hypothetical protein
MKKLRKYCYNQLNQLNHIFWNTTKLLPDRFYFLIRIKLEYKGTLMGFQLDVALSSFLDVPIEF